MAIGGYDQFGFYIDDVEVVDMVNPDNRCARVPPYPHPIYLATGALINGRPRHCGGREVIEINFTRIPIDRETCYEYVAETDEWVQVESMSMKRKSPASSLLEENVWLITGGYSADVEGGEQTSEIWRDGGFVPGPPAANSHGRSLPSHHQ